VSDAVYIRRSQLGWWFAACLEPHTSTASSSPTRTTHNAGCVEIGCAFCCFIDMRAMLRRGSSDPADKCDLKSRVAFVAYDDLSVNAAYLIAHGCYRSEA
jgi:hypothetical protein